VAWLRQVLLPRRLPQTEVPELESLQEMGTMLAERDALFALHSVVS
jgi:hypothetical protein